MLDRIELIKTFIKEGSVVAEIGVQSGWLTEYIMQQNPWYVGVDCWENFVHQNQNDAGNAKEVIKKMRTDLMFKYSKWKNVWFLHEFSDQAAKRFSENYFDFIYIDGDHTYKAVLNDLNVWWNKLKVGGVMAGHDYCEAVTPVGVEFGVIPAVQEFIKDKKQTVEITTEEGRFKSFFIIKK